MTNNKLACLTTDRINKFIDTSRQNQLPITPQKRAIFEAVAGVCHHPTAEEIHKMVLEQFPTMSFATVYKNLKKFCELDLIKEITTDNCVKRYDANMDHHHHVVDSKTGMITDTYINGDIPLPKELTDKNIKSIQITYTI
jgi:Fur family transcriptional regulator, peroxide stress response regulator